MAPIAAGVVVVTGAGSGIGRCLSLRLGAEGARLVLVGRRVEALRACAGEVAARGGRPPMVAACDVTDAAAVAELGRRVAAGPGVVRVLVNNAGRGAYGSFHEVALEDHRAVIDTNLTGLVHMTHTFLPSMLDGGGGHLVFVSSVLGELPAPDHAVYGATKFAVTGLAESLRHELHRYGVAVSVVEPGPVRSDFQRISGTPPQRFERLAWQTPEAAAEDIWKVLHTRQERLVSHRLSATAIRLRRHAPRLFARIFAFAYGRLDRPG